MARAVTSAAPLVRYLKRREVIEHHEGFIIVFGSLSGRARCRLRQ